MKRVTFLIFTSFLLGNTIHIPADFLTIQAGIDTAEVGDTVLVAAGTYYENIVWPVTNGIKLIGYDRETTMIDGDSLASVIRFEEELGGIIDTTTVISGFTIQNGYVMYLGGGIYCYRASPSLEKITISNNTALWGGGIYCSDDSNPVLSSVTICDNVAGRDGGGIFCSNSYVSLSDAVISSNSAGFDGGGIFCEENSGLSISSVTIHSNYAGCFFGGSGGGICSVNDIGLDLSNVTIYGNIAEIHGGGIYCRDSSPNLVNCILWNDSPQEIYVSSNSEINMSYSNIQGDWEGDGNIGFDPLFCDAENGDYHLAENSPCVDAGEDGANMGAFGIGCDAQGQFADLNMDGTINVLDVVQAVGIILGTMTPTEYQLWAADVNEDGAINVLDVVQIVNIALNAKFTDTMIPSIATITQTDNTVTLQADGAVAGVQIETDGFVETRRAVSLPAGFEFAQNNGTVLIYSPSGATMSGTTELFTFAGDITITDMIVADARGNAVETNYELSITNYELGNAYPNPFNPVTTIQFGLPKDSEVKLVIYDLLGREIAKLINTNLEAGYHEIQWNGQNALGQAVSSGVYFYRMSTPEFQNVKKMVLLQ